MELDPRTSMERHLMDRDREGQLYLESRRQQAAQELLSNRASFLSTITPPSTSPSSAASSLFREPLSTSSVAATAASAAGSTQGEDIEVLESPLTPTTPAVPTTLLIPPPAITATTTTATTPTTPTFLNVTSPFQSFVPSIKSRQRSATSHGRVLEVPDRPLVAISPSSLEYQLTASLLNYRQPPPSPRDPNSAGSRSKARLLNTRRATISSDVRIDSRRLAEATAAALLEASSSTGQPGHRRKRGSKDSNIPDNVEMYRKRHDGLELPRRKYSPGELTSTSLPSSPTGTHAQFGYQGAAPFSNSSEYPLPQHPLHLLQQQQHSHVASSSSSVHPTSPLPPKSPRSLIAHYFPGSLPPPPSRNRGLARNREPLVAPTPFRTPTFGPQSKQDANSPALPSPSGSFHCIPSTTISRSSTAQPHAPEDKDSDALSSRPSPSTSAIGIPTSAGKQPHQRHHPHHSQPSRHPCDQDACGSRGCFHNHIQHTIHNLARNQHINNFVYGGCITAEDSTPIPPTSTAVTEPPSASGSGSGSGGLLISAPAAVGGAGPGIHRAPSTAALTTSPVYPSPLADYRHPAIIRLQQKPVPYVRELVPGREDQAMVSPRSGPPSVNTSRDLESVLEGVNGRHRNNRMSLDPWSYYASTSEEKRNPSLRREQGSRYWVFRDQNGIVPGPFLFLFGFLLPFLWWIGSVYPRQEHPDSQPLSEQGTVDEHGHAKKSGYSWAVQWLQKRIAFIRGGDMDKHPPMTIAHLHNTRISQDTDREGSTLEPPGHINASSNVSATHIPLPPPIHTLAHGRVDTHGPWSADDHAASLYEQRLEHGRKVWRYELDMRWKRINLISSFGSFVLAILITAFVIGFS
ncbi:hypothetical protein BGX34_002138 [Mortierella sp. NVP85]|nr:hypothetical protein BGX34_002138 [Mortierella sp. NVP85]